MTSKTNQNNEEFDIFHRELTDAQLVKKNNEPSLSYAKTKKTDSVAVQKIDQNIKKRYKKAVATTDIAKFHQESLLLVLDHLKQGEFGGHKAFIREIEYFLHYLFLMLQDDFFFGEKLFVQRMTKLDDYIFSQYRREPNLEENIQKITVLSYSNRFDKDPRANLLSYFVFIEESGIELIVLLQDFYTMLQKTQKSKRWFNFNDKSKKIHKSYLKLDENKGKKFSSNLSSMNTFYTVEPSFFENSKDAQIKIYQDILKPIPSNSKN